MILNQAAVPSRLCEMIREKKECASDLLTTLAKNGRPRSLQFSLKSTQQ